MIIDFILSLPVLVKVLGSLALVLALNVAIKSLMAAIGSGAVVLGLWSGQSLTAIGRIAWNRFSSLDNLLLLLLVCQIITLSSLMAETGVMTDLVQAVRRRVSHRLSFAALPAVIGLLPMPGGAMFSAPMVDKADSNSRLSAILKARTNYWFRHVWEYWWPLYPGVILALDMTGLEVWQFVIVQLPVTGFAIAAGYLFLLRRIPRDDEADDPHSARGNSSSFLALTAPISTVICTYAAVALLFPSVRQFSRYIPIILGLVFAFVVVQIQRRPGWGVWKKTLFSRRTLYMALLVAVIRIYGAMVEARLPSGLLLVEQMRGELTLLGVPETLFIAIIPFVTGLAVGINVGTIGASFPVIMTVLGSSPALPLLLSTTVLAYVAGFMGQMLSPVHVCLVVTNQYFKTSLLRSLGGLLLPALLVTAGAFAWTRVMNLVLVG